jgi:hypothetical protein
MSRRQPRPPDTGLSPSPNPPGVGLEAAQPRISDPRQLGHRSDPGQRVRSAASRRARTSWSRVSRAAARRRRLRAARHLSEHASRFRGSRGPPQTTQTGWGEPTGAERSGVGRSTGGDRRGNIPTGSGPQWDRRRQRTRQRRPLRGEQRVNVEDVPRLPTFPAAWTPPIVFITSS